MMRRNNNVFLAIAIAALGGLHAQAARPKLAKDLQDCRPNTRCDVIVQLKEGADAAALQRLVSRGATNKQDLKLIRSHVLSTTASDLAAIANDPAVEYVAPDRPLRSTAFSGTPDYGWMTVSG